MITITPNEYAALENVANTIGVNPTWLVDLISFESGFNPTIKNPNPESSARGLIQFINEVARELGYISSLDLVNKNPTIEGQLLGPVKEYLKKYMPYPTKQALYMGVFQPAAQYWPLDRLFSAKAREMNPGINTPGDYMRYAEANKKTVVVQTNNGQKIVGYQNAIILPNRIGWWVAAATAAGLFFYLQERSA